MTFIPSNIIELIGYGAATLTTISFIPQVYQTLKTRDVSGISLGMYSLFSAGVLLWFVYGVLNNIMPIIIANALTLILALTVFWFKIKDTLIKKQTIKNKY